MRIKLSLILFAATLVWCLAPAAAQDLRKIFKEVSPSVVVIRAKGQEVTSGGTSRFSETGSGVLISQDGKVMTAAHVVHAMDEISVEFLGGETLKARVVASEPAADLSLLQLDRVPPGAQVSPLAEFFQTNATINAGNSGGPMFASNGEVLGIVSHNVSKGGGSEGLGFVVAINTAKKLLLEKKSFWTGTEAQILPDDIADLLNVPPGLSGLVLKTVAKSSPAADIGLRGATMIVDIGGEKIPLGGDILLSVEGIPTGSPANLAKVRDVLASKAPGAPFKVTILRAGRVLELTGKAPSAQ